MSEVAIYGAMPLTAPEEAAECMNTHGLHPGKAIPMLPFAGAVGKEIRHLYFGAAVGEDGLFRKEPVLTQYTGKILQSLQVTRLFSFGTCNAACPYCKRDMQFIGDDGQPLETVTVPLYRLFEMAEGAVSRGEVVRFSGGDPVEYPKVCRAIGEYVRHIGGTVSIAHNGSGGAGFVTSLLPLMSSAAIDIKAPRRYMATVLGVNSRVAERHFENSFAAQAVFSSPANTGNALLDIRTPIFGAHPDPAVPQTTTDDMLKIAGMMEKAGNNPRRCFWTWRMYKPVHGCDWLAPSLEDTIEMLETVSDSYPLMWMGIRAKWHGGGMLYFRGGHCLNPGTASDKEARGSGNTGDLMHSPE